MKTALSLCLAAACGLALPAHSEGMLYKAVSANGTVIFSDTPPAGNVTIVEQRALPSTGPSQRNAAVQGVAAGAALFEGDAEIARANEKVDLAEHALALARRDFAGNTDPMKMQLARMTLADRDKLEFYKRNVIVARQYLTELVRERLAMQGRTLVATADAQQPNRILVSANYATR